MIISDGWDRGDPDLLGREMARLQRSCRRLIWLNPLLGAPGYQPLTQGMRAAMPYIDEFMPIHNLQSLEALAELLGRVEDQPPFVATWPPPRPPTPVGAGQARTIDVADGRDAPTSRRA